MPEQSDGGKPPMGGLGGRYANYFEVGHNAVEFLILFGQMYSEGDEPQFHTRIVTSPAYAKELSRVLTESLNEYQTSFGCIKDAE